MDGITKDDSELVEEVFRDIAIDTDGLVASVNFDYSVLRNGEETHWGREMWHLVHTDDGWKELAMLPAARCNWP